MAPRIFFRFDILICFFKYKTIENHARAFLPLNTYALSFYVTKTVLVGPKWFWSDQIDLDLTIMI